MGAVGVMELIGWLYVCLGDYCLYCIGNVILIDYDVLSNVIVMAARE